jgi:preprotein translocase subunit YajC
MSIHSVARTISRNLVELRRAGQVATGIAVAVSANSAFAQAPATGAPPAPIWAQLMPFVFMIGIFYVLIIRPQQKQRKAHQEFLSKLKRGDEVVTNSGILGRVEGLTDTVVTLEIADGVRVKVLRSMVSTSLQSATQTEASPAGGKA